MEAADMEEVMKVLQSSLSQIKWRLRPSSKRRLETDVLALCSRMRPVIMVDYGGKMPELKDQLCAFLKLSQKESSIFKHLRVMVIEDMIYLIHVEGLAELVKSSLNSEMELNFVDIEKDPPMMITKDEESSLGNQLIAVQELFAMVFPGDEADNELLRCHTSDSMATADTSTSELNNSQCSEFIDLSSCMQDTLVTVPTLNGNGTSSKGSRQEELMSFSVPYDLSIEGSNEPWAEAFMTRMQARLERCSQVWGSLKLEMENHGPPMYYSSVLSKGFSLGDPKLLDEFPIQTDVPIQTPENESNKRTG